MGAWGWRELADYTVLEGIAEAVDSAVADDGDWCFKVRPASGYERLLRNNGYQNTNGLVECEVEPPDRIGGESAEDDAVLRRYLGPLQGRRVRVVGTWAADCAHAYDGGTCYLGCCDKGKTEIHPIASIMCEMPPPTGAVKRLELFVFSDSSSNFPAHVPHSGTSRIGDFFVPIGPVAHPDGPTNASYAVASEVDMAEYKSLGVVQSGGQWIFHGVVVSGVESAGRGFYHATIDLHYVVPKRLELSASSLKFGGVDVGSSSAKQVAVRNAGTTPLSVSIPGAPAGPFQWAAWSGTLAAAQSHQMTVTFRPTAAGPQTGGVGITSDAPGSPHRVALTGAGRSPQCASILASIEAKTQMIEELQEELQSASPNEKAALVARIRRTMNELAGLQHQATELGCV